MLVSGEKPGFQALSKGLIVLLCVEVVRQGVPDHGAVHSECLAWMHAQMGRQSENIMPLAPSVGRMEALKQHT